MHLREPAKRLQTRKYLQEILIKGLLPLDVTIRSLILSLFQKIYGSVAHPLNEI
ncbi:hypothetical protein RRSWK_03200 [Rhodopirellula sp. SWK7]|nr:hypothetical protein RRSWK_03200 [Rhodopirellula sp. SWK7]